MRPVLHNGSYYSGINAKMFRTAAPDIGCMAGIWALYADVMQAMSVA